MMWCVMWLVYHHRHIGDLPVVDDDVMCDVIGWSSQTYWGPPSGGWWCDVWCDWLISQTYWGSPSGGWWCDVWCDWFIITDIFRDLPVAPIPSQQSSIPESIVTRTHTQQISLYNCNACTICFHQNLIQINFFDT
jgi:hypothetical protein